MRHSFIVTLAATTIVFAATAPSWADSTVKVSLTGERMEKMGMTLDTTTVKAGMVTFLVTNDAARTGHEMIVVRLKSKDETLPLNTATHRIDERAIKSLGEVSDLKPNQHGQLKVKMAAGDYILICNIKGHFEAGMTSPFTVTP